MKRKYGEVGIVVKALNEVGGAAAKMPKRKCADI
jgi:hypothetical protein